MFGIEVPDGTAFEYVDEFVMWDKRFGRVACDGPCTQADGLNKFEIRGEFDPGQGRITMYRGAFTPFDSAVFQAPGKNITYMRELNLSPAGGAVWTLGHEAAHARGIEVYSGHPHLQAEYHGYQAYQQYRALMRGN